MSSKDIAVSVRGLSKSYSIAHNAAKHTTLGEALMHRFRRPMERAERETFWALKDVSFDIKKGDVVGIIGRNGAGKSTLLKILSRITEPTTGAIDLYGRVGSLLEVGTGFHPELTGRENIYLNGAILGMKRSEITRQFDAIVDFAEVEKFLDTPVKRYSSGMYVRLAFAVAAHLNPEILIVDEVLAVGDSEFQKKCLGKMNDVAKTGRTVLFVSHQLDAVSKLCNRAVYLNKGCLNYIGEANSAIQNYVAERKNHGSTLIENRAGKDCYITSVISAEPLFEPNQEKIIRLHVDSKQYSGSFFVSGLIVNEQGLTLCQFDSRLVTPLYEGNDCHMIELSIKNLWLKPGEYVMNLYLCTSAGIIDTCEDALRIHVSPHLPYPNATDFTSTRYGVVFPDFSMKAIDLQ